MRFTEIRHAYERQADRGNLKEDQVGLMVAATIYEAAAERAALGFYGPKLLEQARKDVDAARGQTEIQRWEALGGSDFRPITDALRRETIVTTLDLPAVLGRARDLVIQAAEEPYSTDSALLAGSAKATRSDFREAKTLKKELDALGVYLQPEGTNVRYEGFEYSEVGYSVSKYSRAIGWTWEAKVNDDLTGFLDQAEALGYAARMNRVKILAEATVAGTARSTPSGTNAGGTAAVGGPTIANLVWARETLAANVPPRRFGQIAIPIALEGLAAAARDNQFIPGSTPAELNPAYATFTVNVEEIVPLVLTAAGAANDWLAYDARIASWLEFATLDGFQGGPRIAFKLPDTRDADLGSFDNMTDAMKVVDVVAAKVTDGTRVLRVKSS